MYICMYKCTNILPEQGDRCMVGSLAPSHKPVCAPSHLPVHPTLSCALFPIQLLFGWPMGPVRLRGVWRCTSMESGEQFVATVGIR